MSWLKAAEEIKLLDEQGSPFIELSNEAKKQAKLATVNC